MALESEKRDWLAGVHGFDYAMPILTPRVERIDTPGLQASDGPLRGEFEGRNWMDNLLAGPRRDFRRDLCAIEISCS